jgi:large subunit ribosomal protein L3
MAMGLVGKKLGMSRVFQENGRSVPVTVILVEPNRITQVKTESTDGYSALQVTLGLKKANRLIKPEAGVFATANVEPGLGLWELRADKPSELEGLAVGATVGLERLSVGQKIDVVAISKGKGTAGTVKRYNFRTQDATHGNSRSHRSLGSTGQNQTPGRVFKGKKMPGRMGNERVSVQNLEVVKIDAERCLVLVKGAVPGAEGGIVFIRPAVKHMQTA